MDIELFVNRHYIEVTTVTIGNAIHIVVLDRYNTVYGNKILKSVVAHSVRTIQAAKWAAMIDLKDMIIDRLYN